MSSLDYVKMDPTLPAYDVKYAAGDSWVYIGHVTGATQAEAQALADRLYTKQVVVEPA